MKIRFNGLYDLEFKEERTTITDNITGETFFDEPYFVENLSYMLGKIKEYEFEAKRLKE